MGIRTRNDPRLRAAIEDGALRLRQAGGARLALSTGNDAVQFTMSDMQRLKVAYVTLLPSVEKLLLGMLRKRVESLRKDYES